MQTFTVAPIPVVHGYVSFLSSRLSAIYRQDYSLLLFVSSLWGIETPKINYDLLNFYLSFILSLMSLNMTFYRSSILGGNSVNKTS